ncbi:MAG: ABC transporter permease [Aeriscardovia sp.]|nr:ABC transporter permease [Aeriscardovia sp.]
MKKRGYRIWIGIGTFAILIAIWQICVCVGKISPRVLSSPWQICVCLVEYWPSVLSSATLITGLEGFLGFLASIPLGLALGIGLYSSKTVQSSLYPLIVVAQMLPLITIAPLFIIWFGFSPAGKGVMVAVFSIFPIAVQTFRGLNKVPEEYVDVAKSCGAGRFWILLHVKLRLAAPQIFGGMKIATAYVFATAATAEYLGARNGLGIVLQSAFESFQTPLIFSATIVIIAMTALLWLLVSISEWAVSRPKRSFLKFGRK